MTDLATEQVLAENTAGVNTEAATASQKEKPATEAKKKSPAKEKAPKVKNEKTTKTANRSRRGEPEKLSNPTMIRTVNLSTLQAHRVYLRTMRYVSNSLFNLGVILHIIGDRNDAAVTEKIISNEMEAVNNELSAALEQSKVVFDKVGITALVKYSHLISEDVTIQAPLTMKYVNLLEKMDELIRHIDTLWMQGTIESSSRAYNNSQWQSRLTKLANEIINTERRAHASAVNKGKSAELEIANVSKATENVSDDEDGDE